MPLRLDVKKKLSARSDRVKCVEIHPTEPWVLSALYSGNVCIWDYNTQTVLKQFEVCQLPVRCAKFVARKQWVVTASDDMCLRAFNYNTLERVKKFEAHGDYIRHLAVHPSLPYILTGSDDMTIKLWDWDKNWTNTQTFEGHVHYVMMVNWNPKDNHIFASASLDRSIKVWGIAASGSGSTAAHFTLSGHQRGVNCVEYSPSGEKPYLVSGSDDRSVRVWDYQTKQCIQELTGHSNNISVALFHPVLPVILTGSEDGCVRVWHQQTYRLETSLNYLLERVWSIGVSKGSNHVAIGFDEGTMVIKMGNDEPMASMVGNKVIWAKGSDIQTANLKLAEDAGFTDGEVIPLSVKDMGSSELFPQSLSHHPSGRFFAVCGDGEYIVYTAQALRNKCYGKAVEFVWSSEGHFATRDTSGRIAIFHNFVESFSFIPPFACEELFGGYLLGVRCADFICFYDWTEYRLVRRIDVSPRSLHWSDDGRNLIIACPDQFYMLRFDKEILQAAIVGGAPQEEDGIEAAFDLAGEFNEKVSSGTWIGSDCFISIQQQRLHCLVAGQSEVLMHLDRSLTILRYVPEMDRLFCIDRDLNIIPFTIHMSLIEYQSAIINRDFDKAQTFYQQIPESLHTRVARFLEHQGWKQEALEISKDPEHKFELALALDRYHVAADIIRATDHSTGQAMVKGKWKTLGDAALDAGEFALARSCYEEANEYSSLLLFYMSCGDAQGLKKTAEEAKAAGRTNVAFLCYFALQDTRACLNVLLEAKRLPEAGFFARAYCPSEVPSVVKKWKDDLALVNEQMAGSLADPEEYEDLFPNFKPAIAVQQIVEAQREKGFAPAAQYTSVRDVLEMDMIDELTKLGPDAFANAWGTAVMGEIDVPEVVASEVTPKECSPKSPEEAQTSPKAPKSPEAASAHQFSPPSRSTSQLSAHSRTSVNPETATPSP